MGNDWTSAVRLPYGYTVDLYIDDGFQGSSKTIVGPMFEDGHLEMNCIDLTDFDNRVTSLKIYKNQELGSAYGRWIAMTGSSSLTYELHEGFTSTHSESYR